MRFILFLFLFLFIYAWPCVGDCAAQLAAVAQVQPPSTTFLPLMDPDYVWEEVIDVVDNYFRVQEEQRVKAIGNTFTEGRIDTWPDPSATLLEPWRRDVATAYDRLEATFQTIRRRALVRVVPAQGGFLIDVAVFKELEDLPRPERAPTGSATFRNEMSLSRFNEPVGPQATTTGWIPLGRDVAMEQKILCKVQSRFGKKIGWPFVAAPYPVGPECASPPGMAPPEAEPLPPPAAEPPRQLLPPPAS
jgi:hypothetical protein